jgi:hypothetical protein
MHALAPLLKERRRLERQILDATVPAVPAKDPVDAMLDMWTGPLLACFKGRRRRRQRGEPKIPQSRSAKAGNMKPPTALDELLPLMGRFQ